MKKDSDDEMTELADAAFRRASRKAAKIALQTDTPLIIWKKGALAKVYPSKKKTPVEKTSRKSKE